MRLSALLVGLALVAGFAGLGGWLAFGGPTPEAPAAPAPAVPAQQVQGISLDGGRTLPQAALRAVLSTKVGAMLDAARLERDREALEAELAARGYLAAKVAPASVTFVDRGGAYVVFDIELGPMFHLRSVVVTGPGSREAEVVRLAAGDEASRDRLARAKQSLAERLARRGVAQVELRVAADLEAAALDVELVTR